MKNPFAALLGSVVGWVKLKFPRSPHPAIAPEQIRQVLAEMLADPNNTRLLAQNLLVSGAAAVEGPLLSARSWADAAMGTKGPCRSRFTLRARRLASLSATVAVLLLLSQPSAKGQFFSVSQVPTGRAPLGVAHMITSRSHNYLAVANSGDNTVSLFDGCCLGPISNPQVPSLYSVPAPYGVVSCGVPLGHRPFGGFLITSSSGNSVTWLKLSTSDSDGNLLSTELRTINVGPQPYSAACYFEGDGTSTSPMIQKVLVSTLGDNALSLVDLNSGQVTMRIPNVPGNRALHGIVIDRNGNAWVAGTDANVVSVVNLETGNIIVSFPVRQPIAIVIVNDAIDKVFVASGIDNTVTVFNPNTLQVVSTFAIAANPRDFHAYLANGYAAATSSGNSVFKTLYDNNGQVVGSALIADNIPGAFGLAAGVIFSGSQKVGLFITGRDSNSVYLIQSVPQALIPQAFAVSNAASFASTTGIAPGSLASAFAATGVSQNFSASSLPLPKVLGGTLNFDASINRWIYSPTGAVQAALLFVGPNQINFQLPPGISLGDSVPAQLTWADGRTFLSTLRAATTVPGIFTLLQNGQGQAAMLNQNNSQNFGTNPATRGSVIQIFATGAGDTDPPLLPGEAASITGNPLVLSRVQPMVTIGGANAPVQFSGMAPGYVGLWQINAEIPANVTPGNAVPLTITADGVTSNTVTIAVE